MAAVRPLRSYTPPGLPTRAEVCGPVRVLVVAALPGAACDRPAAGVAPLFEHGDGVGAFGCIATSSPSFMSEDEAMAIVWEELEAAGMSDDRIDASLRSVRFPTPRNDEICGSDLVEDDSREVTFEVDVFDNGPGLGVEIVTQGDFESTVLPFEGGICSVSVYDLKGLTRYLLDEVDRHGNGIWFAALYDPVAYDSRDEAEDDLRLQALDLVRWIEENDLL